MQTLSPALSRLRLKHFQLLELLIDVGTLSKAARFMHVSQPVISQMVKDIESAFGVPLFERTSSGVVPNERLQALLRRSRAGLGEFSAAASEITASRRPAPRIRIGGSLHVAINLLPRAFSLLRERHPDLEVVFREGPVTRMLEELSVGELEGVIGRLPTRYESSTKAKELAFWPIYDSEHCIVVGRCHPLAARRRVALKDLQHEPWALGEPGGESREIINQAFLRAGMAPPEPVFTCRPIYINLSIVACTPLVTVAAKADAARARRQGLIRVLPIELRFSTPPIVLFARKIASEQFPLDVFRATITEVAQSL